MAKGIDEVARCKAKRILRKLKLQLKRAASLFFYTCPSNFTNIFHEDAMMTLVPS